VRILAQGPAPVHTACTPPPRRRSVRAGIVRPAALRKPPGRSQHRPASRARSHGPAVDL